MPPIWLVVPVTLVTALAVLPLAYVAWQAMATGIVKAMDLLLRPFVAGLLANTLVLAASVTLGSVVIAVAAAWLVERGDLPWRPLWRVLAPLPLAVPAFVSAFAWFSLSAKFEGMPSAIGVLILAEYPLVYLPVVAAMRGLDPALEDVARSVGHGPWRIFFSTILPQLRPALAGGALLVILHMLVEFGPLALLRVETFTTAIYEAYELEYDGPAAAMLSAVLVGLCLVVIWAELILRGRRRFARLGAGVARPQPRPEPLGLLRWPAFAGLLALATLALGVPLVTVGYWLATSRSLSFTLPRIGSALVGSLELSGLGAIVTTLFALGLVLAAFRHRGRLSVIAERLPYVVHALPGLVVALSLVFFCLRLTPYLYQTMTLLMVAYALLLLPLAQSALRPAVEQVPQAMEEAALSCGRPPWYVLARVTLPAIMPGLSAAGLLVFLQLMKELTATLVLAPTGIDTLSIELWQQSSQMRFGSAAPYAALLVIVSGLPAYLVTSHLQKRYTAS